MTPVFINGADGEGGGQIVRTSLTLSMITGRAVTIENVRAGRSKPGLLRQHLTAVGAAAAICNADVDGAEIGSRSLKFSPRAVFGGEYHFSVGSAGSATLVLQTVLPALLTAQTPSRVVIEGGTHNPWAPPFPFLVDAYLPLVDRMGPRVTATLERHGFYPAGGGRMVIAIDPSKALAGFDLTKRGDVVRKSAVALVSNLPKSIALRELAELQQALGWSREECFAHEVQAQGPGNVVYAIVESEHVREVFTSFGRVGVSAKKVAEELTSEVRYYLASSSPVGPYLADQLLLLLALSAHQPLEFATTQNVQRGGRFRTSQLTDHSASQIAVFQHFLDVTVNVERDAKSQQCDVQVLPRDV